MTEELVRESESAGQGMGAAERAGQYEFAGQRIELSLMQYLPSTQAPQVHGLEPFHTLNHLSPQVQLSTVAELTNE
jgi:hypothetical protein